MAFSRPGRAAFAFIFITVALDMLALGVMIPVLPKLIVSFQGGDVARASMIVGVFGFAWALMQFLFQPVLGALSDRYGRRPRLATFTAMRPPGSSTRAHSANTSLSISR